LCGGIAIFLLEYAYLIYKVKRLNFRAEYGIWLACTVLFLFLLMKMLGTEQEKGQNRRVTVYLVAIGSVCIGLLCIPGWMSLTNNQPYTLQEEYQQFTEYVREHKENLYLGEMWTMDCFGRLIDLSTTPEEGELSNVYATGGCYLRNPRTDQILSNYGVENPIPALVEKENVYLVARYHVELIQQYLSEKFQTYIAYEEEERFGEVGIYRFYQDSSMQMIKSGNFYDDGWFGESGHIRIYNREEAQSTLYIRFLVPERTRGAEVTIVCDGATSTYEVQEGENIIAVELGNETNADIEMRIDKTFNPKELGESGDVRNLSVYGVEVGFQLTDDD
jgi:hypothetical protein